jgi:hypothetical protein
MFTLRRILSLRRAGLTGVTLFRRDRIVAVMAELTQAEWRGRVHDLDRTTQSVLARLLGPSVRSKPRPRYLATRARGLPADDFELVLLLLVQGADDVGRTLLADEYEAPTAEALARVMPAWTQQVPAGVVRLLAASRIDPDRPDGSAWETALAAFVRTKRGYEWPAAASRGPAGPEQAPPALVGCSVATAPDGGPAGTDIVDKLRALATDAHDALVTLARLARTVGQLTGDGAWPDAATDGAVRAALTDVARVREAASALEPAVRAALTDDRQLGDVESLVDAATAIEERLATQLLRAKQTAARRARVVDQLARLRATDPDGEAEVLKVQAAAESVSLDARDGVAHGRDGPSDELVPFEALLDVVTGSAAAKDHYALLKARFGLTVALLAESGRLTIDTPPEPTTDSGGGSAAPVSSAAVPESDVVPGMATGSGGGEQAVAGRDVDGVREATEPVVRARHPTAPRDSPTRRDRARRDTPADADTGEGGGVEPDVPVDALFRDAPVDDLHRPDVDPADALAGVERLLRDNRLGLAAWLARCVAPDLGESLAVLAVACELRGDDGPMTDELWRRSQRLSEAGLHDPAAALVLATACCLAAPLAPYSGCAELLADVAPAVTEDAAVRRLTAAVVRAAQGGLRLRPTESGRPPDRTECEAALVDVRGQAAELLERAPSRRTIYLPASRVYWEWMTSGGLLGRLLTPVVNDDRSAVDEVRREHARLSDDRRLSKELDATDDYLRAPGANSVIDGPARRTVMADGREALDVVDRWLRVVSAMQRIGDGDGERLAGLRAALDRAARGADAWFRGRAAGLLGGDPAQVAAGHALELGWGRCVDLLQHGRVPAPPPTTDAPDGELPLVVETPLTRDDWDKPPRAAAHGLLAAADRDWADAYTVYARLDDHAGTARLIDALRARDPALAERLDLRRAEDLRESRDVLRRKTAVVRSAFEELEHYPKALTAEDAAQARAVIGEAGAYLGEDIRDVTSRLRDVIEQLRHARQQVARQILDRLEEENWADVDADRVRESVRQGDLSAGHEALSVLERDGRLPAADTATGTALLRAFWPAQVDAATAPGIVATAAEVLLSDGELPGYGPGPADPDRRRLHAAALTAWLELAEKKRSGDFDARLRAVLSLLGLARRGQLDAAGHGGYLSANVTASPVGVGASHRFGSSAQGSYLILYVWQRTDPDGLAQIIDREANHLVPCLALYRGTLDRNRRTLLAERLRDSRFAGRDVIVIDDAVMVTLAFTPSPTIATTESLTLPFSSTTMFTPYAGGVVPPELFKGRHVELAAVLDAQGSSFVYGGRQVGKSALLRRAAHVVNDAGDPDRVAVFLDTRGAGIGMYRPNDDLWQLLLRELREFRVVEKTSANAGGVAFSQHVTGWLRASPKRRLWILLDECDELLEGDATAEFPVVERLRALTADTDRRFKVVFAGLHQVQRFERQHLQPMANLTARPINIGPLAPAAAIELLCAPVHAMGYDIEDRALWRLLSYTNYQAGLIQLLGDALLRDLTGASHPGELPGTVSWDRADRLTRAKELTDQIRERFLLTLDLDLRFACIAYWVAYGNYQDGVERAYTPAELLREVREWWPAGFADVREAMFEGTLDEMVQLGVLIRTPAGRAYRMRNVNVMKILGTAQEIDSSLQEIATRAPSSAFRPERFRRFVAGGLAPLSERELSVIVDDSPRAVLLGGSDALCLDAAGALIEAAFADRPDVAVVRVAPADLLDGIRMDAGRTVLLADARTMTSAQAAALAEAATASCEKLRGDRRTRMLRAVILLGPDQLDLWAPEPGGAGGAPPLPALRMVPRRLDAGGLESCAADERLGLHNPADRQRLLKVTGGWPILVNRAVALRQNRPWSKALDEVRGHLADPSGAAEFARAVLGGHRPVSVAAGILVELGNEPAQWSDVVELLVEKLSGAGDVARARAGLLALDVVERQPDGAFALEPVLAAAIRTAADAWRPPLEEARRQ